MSTTASRAFIVKRIQELEQLKQEKLRDFKRIDTQRNELNKQGTCV
jgi:hypothetical protein